MLLFSFFLHREGKNFMDFHYIYSEWNVVQRNLDLIVIYGYVCVCCVIKFIAIANFQQKKQFYIKRNKNEMRPRKNIRFENTRFINIL